jgi:hypothetical protein
MRVLIIGRTPREEPWQLASTHTNLRASPFWEKRRTIEGATEWTAQPNGLNPIRKLDTISNPRLLQRF